MSEEAFMSVVSVCSSQRLQSYDIICVWVLFVLGLKLILLAKWYKWSYNHYNLILQLQKNV